MIFEHFLLDNNESNAFILACEETREALLVDAGCWDDAIADFIDKHGLRLGKVFITHDHYDHTEGLTEILARYQPEIFGGRGRAGQHKAVKVAHGDAIHVGRLTGKVLDTSGHTADSMSLVFPGMAFTGDALFAGSIGGCGSPKATQREIELVRKNIFSLPPDYEVHTGHGPSSTVAVEKNSNPFFV